MQAFTRFVAAAVGAALVGAMGPGAVVAAPSLADRHDTARLVGWDTYRHLDRLPYLSTGVQTLQYSSFDRTGGNDKGSGPCLRQGGAGCVVAEDRGPGEIESIWFTRDNGVVTALGSIRIELDGTTVVDAPLQSVVDGKLGSPFVYPLVANGDQSPGGVYIKVPMPYRSAMRVSIGGGLQFYHVTYRHFPDPDGVATFNRADRADDVVAMLHSAGAKDPKPSGPDMPIEHGAVNVPAGQTVTIAEHDGPAAVSALRLRLPAQSDAVLSGLRLRIGFDGTDLVDSPVGEFFGAGLGTSAVRSLMFTADPSPAGWFTTWWPMPFARTLTVRLTNTTAAPIAGVATDVMVRDSPEWSSALASGRAGYFTARSHAGPTTLGEDWMFAEEPGGHGKFVGVSETIRGRRSNLPGIGPAPFFLEGGERVHVDRSPSPQLYGTGTEDFYEAGWYFRNGQRFSDPFNGQPNLRTSPEPGCADYCLATYRLMLGDAVDYRDGLQFGMLHGPRNTDQAIYSSTAFLYTHPTQTLTRGPELDVSDPGRSVLASVYEGIADTVTVSNRVHAATHPVEFTLPIPPGNDGIMLRRTSDQSIGYQSAEVSIDGVPVGTWLQPRSNPTQRWLADTFALPAAVTRGKSTMTVRLAPTPGSPPWTAARYRADAETSTISTLK